MKAFLVSVAMACGAALPSASFAEMQPISYSSDPRIRYFTYDRNDVYRLDTFMRFITSIEFERGEVIESVQAGDSASWEITRLNRGDVLAIKPLIEGAATNITVYTDRRVYTFEVRSRSAQAGSRALNYRVSFRYPEVEARRRTQQAERASRPMDTDYFAAGAAEFAPTRVYSDGVSTYFTFPPNAPRPSIFRVDARGRESIVNVRQTRNGARIDSVSDLWTVRIGDEEICIAHGRAIGRVPGGNRATPVPGGVTEQSIQGGVVLK